MYEPNTKQGLKKRHTYLPLRKVWGLSITTSIPSKESKPFFTVRIVCKNHLPLVMNFTIQLKQHTKLIFVLSLPSLLLQTCHRKKFVC